MSQMPNSSYTATGARLTVAGLFAGIGGIELGLSAAGHHTTTVLCEIDEGARRVLRQHFPGLPRRKDVRLLRSLPCVDIVTAGFPCQDLSQAGRTAGITGKNSGLIQHVFELLERAKKKPTWLLLENVPFMLQLDRGQGMRYLIDELERQKFTWAYRIVDANAFGLPQRRQRVILLASRTEDPKRVLFADDAEPINPPFSRDRWCGFYWTEGLRGLGWAVDAVPTLKGGSTIGIPSPPAIWIPETDFIGTPGIEDAERLQGFSAGWTEPAAQGTKAQMRNQVLRRRLQNHRWKRVGNAVSVRVAEWIGQRLASPGEYDPARTGALLGRGVAWPRAAWGRNQEVYPVAVSMWPVARPAPPLSDPPHTIAVGLTMVNIAREFLSPTLNAFDVSTRPPVWSTHSQPADATAVVDKLRELPRRSRDVEEGYDALAILIVNCRNDGTPAALVTDPPAPQPGDVHHYEMAVHRIAQLYEQKYGSVT